MLAVALTAFGGLIFGHTSKNKM